MRPNFQRSPSTVTASIAATLCTMLPSAIERDPQGVVSGHAAERGLRARRDIHREPQVMGTQFRVERVEHDAGLHYCGRGLRVDGKHPVQVLGVIDDEGLADGLAALR